MEARRQHRVDALAAEVAIQCGLDPVCLSEAIDWLLQTAPADRLTGDQSIREAIADAAALHASTRSTLIAADRWADLRRSLISTARARFPGVEAEDLVEDTICDMLSGWCTFRFEARLHNWGRLVLFHKYAQRIRFDKASKRGAGKDKLSLELLTEQGLEPASTLSKDNPQRRAEVSELLHLILDEIRAACREAGERRERDFKIGLMKYLKGYSNAEISRELRVSQPTVGRVVGRIERHLVDSPELVRLRQTGRMKGSGS